MSRATFPLVLTLFLVTAGCVAVDAPPTTAEESREAAVTRVVDGDTVEVRFDDGTTDTVRLLGVDSPEIQGRNDPGEFEGVPDTPAGRRCLAGAAHGAWMFAERHLAGARVRVVVDRAADRRDRYGRLLAYVVLPNGADVNHRLVATGNARVYDTTFSRSDRYGDAETAAQAERLGLWACREPASVGDVADSPLRVAEVHADAAGNDHENLEDEYVILRNAGNGTIGLTGWAVSDEGGHVYRFPEGFALAPGATVSLYTGEGADTAETLYWGSDGAVWNNDGDTVTVRNASGAVVLRHAY